MTRPSVLVACFAAAVLGSAATPAVATQPATVDTYVRAESDLTMKRYVDQGAFGTLLHLRQVTPIGRQDVRAPCASSRRGPASSGSPTRTKPR